MGKEIDQIAETRKAIGRDQIRIISEKIDGNHAHVKAFVKGIADSGKFLKLFSDYTGGLGETRSDEADQLLLDNIVFARKKAAKLTEGLEHAEKLLRTAKELAEEIKRVEIESGLVVVEPPDTQVETDFTAVFDAVVPTADGLKTFFEELNEIANRPAKDEDKPFEADGFI